ncbi:MAG: hypothetical protein QF733_02405 [Phycisphaerales bacterium]|jgi:hypothetical protein|nr:hypothetical protein [Phycisphaerales bacterium]
MFKTFAFAGAATVAASATAGTPLMDQIGANNGADMDSSNILASQYFEAAYSVYDIAAIDDFDNGSGSAASAVSACISGWNGYAGIDGVNGLQVNFYMAVEDAAASLVGYASVDAAVTLDPDWTGQAFGDVVTVEAVWSLAAGTQYVSVIPGNEFAVNGQTGIAVSFIGDLNCWQANPGGGFGMPDNWQTGTNNLAYRVMGGTGDPCAVPLPPCPADVSGPAGEPDGIVDVNDVLATIGTFGEIGDGTYRPTGDCWPEPAGDCAVTVDDLLTVIGAFGEDCRPRGACCFGISGCDDDVLEEDCAADWLGADSDCSECHAGACCYIDGSCTEGTPAECTVAGGTYAGDGVDCAAANCPQPSPGACCITNTDCLDGLLPTDCSDFGGTYMGSGTDCATTSCGWEGCPGGSTSEGVPCQEDTTDPNADPNGGMNVDPPAFGAIANGETICGLMSTYTCIGCDGGADATYRDTDWYLFDNSAGGEWTISGGGEMDLVMGIVDNDALAFVDYFVVAPYEEGTTTVTLPAGGNYSVWVGFNFDGGTNPCSTGLNEYSVTLTGAAAPAAACCVLTECVGDLDPTDCASLGGTYVSGESCATYACPAAFEPCNTGNGEDPLGIDDSWTAGTSDTGSGYLRAMGVTAPSVSQCTVYGLALAYSGGWSECGAAADMGMQWSLMSDGGGLPGADLATGAGGTYAGTDLVYAGAYALHGWTFDMGYAGSVDWVSVASTSSGQGECWFLWMSSTASGAGASAIDDGTGWIAEVFSLNYCITE